MADFIMVSDSKGVNVINLDQVRRATQDSQGRLTLEFAPDHHVNLEGAQASEVMHEINERWSKKKKPAAA